MAEGARRGLDIPRERLAVFCRAHGVCRLSLFGSVLREDFSPDSDVDILVEFTPGAEVSLLDMARMEQELGAMLGRKVDLRTPRELSRYFRDDVMRAAEVQFAEG
jgi:uncharacterized protein